MQAAAAAYGVTSGLLAEVQAAAVAISTTRIKERRFPIVVYKDKSQKQQLPKTLQTSGIAREAYGTRCSACE